MDTQNSSGSLEVSKRNNDTNWSSSRSFSVCALVAWSCLHVLLMMRWSSSSSVGEFGCWFDCTKQLADRRERDLVWLRYAICNRRAMDTSFSKFHFLILIEIKGFFFVVFAVVFGFAAYFYFSTSFLEFIVVSSRRRCYSLSPEFFFFRRSQKFSKYFFNFVKIYVITFAFRSSFSASISTSIYAEIFSSAIFFVAFSIFREDLFFLAFCVFVLLQVSRSYK